MDTPFFLAHTQHFKITLHSLEHIDIEIDNKCNLTCFHCSANAGNQNSGSVSPQVLKEILHTACSLGLKRVGLTGGEPLMNIPKLAEIAQFCSSELQIPLHTHINGTLVSKEMTYSGCILSRFESISITFLGDSKETHDEVTAQEGSFLKAIDGVSTLVSAGLPLTCYIVPIKGKCSNFIGLLEDLIKIGVDKIRILALSPSGRARSIYKQVVPEINEIHQLEQELINLRETKKLVIEAGYCTWLSMPKLSKLSGHESCTSGINRLHINYKGELFPCTAASGVKELKIANINQNSFDLYKIWHENDLLKKIRAMHFNNLEECCNCSQTTKCQQGCMVNTCGTMSKELKDYCPLVY